MKTPYNNFTVESSNSWVWSRGSFLNTININIPPEIKLKFKNKPGNVKTNYHACEVAQKMPLCLPAVSSLLFNDKYFPCAVQITKINIIYQYFENLMNFKKSLATLNKSNLIWVWFGNDSNGMPNYCFYNLTHYSPLQVFIKLKILSVRREVLSTHKLLVNGLEIRTVR